MEINSPLQQIQLPSKHSIWMKRDDLIDPFISGNKWRKLKYILADAANQGKNHLVTFGGAYSNHLVATAAAAARGKLKATAFVRGEEVNNEMLTICKLYGMKLIFIDREAYRDKEALFAQYFATNPEAYFIDEGGACEDAVKGCAEIIDELPEDFDHICCAAGTGTTAAGLLRGINNKNLKTQLHVVAALKGGSFLAEEIKKYEPHTNQLTLHTQYHFGGYAKTSPELLKFMTDFMKHTGILIDPVYTGKMCYAINDLLEKGNISSHAKILAIHTGGLLGILGMKDQFNQILG
jgi:1-aminocyclopropane-1-carboxylate deaminase